MPLCLTLDFKQDVILELTQDMPAGTKIIVNLNPTQQHSEAKVSFTASKDVNIYRQSKPNCRKALKKRDKK